MSAAGRLLRDVVANPVNASRRLLNGFIETAIASPELGLYCLGQRQVRGVVAGHAIMDRAPVHISDLRVGETDPRLKR